MTQLEIRRRESGPGLELVDRLERKQETVETPVRVDPTPADTESFVYPVETAVTFTTASLSIDASMEVRVLDESGEFVATVMDGDVSVEPGTYYISLSDRIKTYLSVEAPDGIDLTLDTDADEIQVDFGSEQQVRLGIRSLHQRPAETITTTGEPADLMRAVSALGSAMKTTTPHRSYGTLRGHPPEIELGEEPHLPADLEVPDTGIRLELPRERSLIYASAPLAFYLCTDIVPGDEPRLVTDSGFEHALDTHRGVEGELERVLKQVFLFDCLIRSEGAYGQRLSERDELEPKLDLDLADLYDRSPAEQVEAYLSVPYDTVEEYVPTWSVTAHVESTPDSAELLPYLVNELATVRSPSAAERTTLSAPAGGESDDFTRSAAASAPSPGGPGTETSSWLDQSDTGPTLESDSDEREIVVPEPDDSHRQVWAAAGIPVGAGKPLKEGYQHQFDRELIEDDIEILVVCNDDSMAVEDSAVRELLGDSPGLSVRIRPFRGLYTHELRALLQRGADFFHFIGHVDDRGLECPDGYLDVHSLDTVGVDAFFLNACDSYAQGRALVEQGAITGVVTLTDVLNSTAVDVGRDMARLLNHGLPISNALDVAQEVHPDGDQYTVIGDGSLQVTQDRESGPVYGRIERAEGGDGFVLDYQVFTTTQWKIGGEYRLWLDSASEVFLYGGDEGVELDREDVVELLELGNIPVNFEGDLRWTDDIDPAEL